MWERLGRIRAETESILSFLPPLITRVVVGYGFFLTGRGKLAHLDDFIDQFEKWEIPYPHLQAPMVAGLEYVGGMALLAGLLTRPFALALAGSMVVAILKVDHTELFASFTSESEKVPTDITSFAYLILLLWLALYGAGTFSVDRILGWGRWRPDPKADEPAE